jgi:putative SOS response-associated peptidase YedK
MCSNFEPIKKPQSNWVKKNLECDLPEGEWKEHVFKYYMAPFVFVEDGVVKCELGHFGLIPPWTDPEERSAFAQKTYNARTETVEIRKSYRSPWKKRKFGLVLADFFYEPLYDESGKISRPTAISRANGEPTAIASIWESFVEEQTGKIVRSFSMLTVNAENHPLMSRFHAPADEKRSVVVIENENFDDWLRANHSEARELLKLSPDGYLEADLSKPITSQLSILE